MNDVARIVAASYIPPASMLFFGAQVGHDKAREEQAMATCRKCGGLLVEGTDDDPLDDTIHPKTGDAMVVVCGGCMRSHYDESLALRCYTTAQADERANRNRAEHDAHKVEHGCNCGDLKKPPTNREHNRKVMAKAKAKRKAS